MNRPQAIEMLRSIAARLGEDWRNLAAEAIDVLAHHGIGPVSDPAETLALIAEHRLTVKPAAGSWEATAEEGAGISRVLIGLGVGPTIGDAVRACVARIKEQGA